MDIFIDESLKGVYVMGAVVGQRLEVEDAIKITRSFIKKHNKSGKNQINLPEIKDSIIHRSFPKIKEIVLNNLAKVRVGKGYRPRGIKIYSVYMKKEDVTGLKQTEVYKTLALELLKYVIPTIGEKNVEIIFDVYFDEYGEKIFKNQLYEEIRKTFPDIKIQNLTHVSSRQDKAVQAADVITGSIRRYLIKEDTESLSVFTEKNDLRLRAIKQIKIK